MYVITAAKVKDYQFLLFEGFLDSSVEIDQLYCAWTQIANQNTYQGKLANVTRKFAQKLMGAFTGANNSNNATCDIFQSSTAPNYEPFFNWDKPIPMCEDTLSSIFVLESEEIMIPKSDFSACLDLISVPNSSSAHFSVPIPASHSDCDMEVFTPGFYNTPCTTSETAGAKPDSAEVGTVLTFRSYFTIWIFLLRLCQKPIAVETEKTEKPKRLSSRRVFQTLRKMESVQSMYLAELLTSKFDVGQMTQLSFFQLPKSETKQKCICRNLPKLICWPESETETGTEIETETGIETKETAPEVYQLTDSEEEDENEEYEKEEEVYQLTDSDYSDEEEISELVDYEYSLPDVSDSDCDSATVPDCDNDSPDFFDNELPANFLPIQFSDSEKEVYQLTDSESDSEEVLVSDFEKDLFSLDVGPSAEGPNRFDSEDFGSDAAFGFDSDDVRPWSGAVALFPRTGDVQILYYFYFPEIGNEDKTKEPRPAKVTFGADSIAEFDSDSAVLFVPFAGDSDCVPVSGWVQNLQEHRQKSCLREEKRKESGNSDFLSSSVPDSSVSGKLDELIAKFALLSEFHAANGNILQQFLDNLEIDAAETFKQLLEAVEFAQVQSLRGWFAQSLDAAKCLNSNFHTGLGLANTMEVMQNEIGNLLFFTLLERELKLVQLRKKSESVFDTFGQWIELCNSAREITDHIVSSAPQTVTKFHSDSSSACENAQVAIHHYRRFFYRILIFAHGNLLEKEIHEKYGYDTEEFEEVEKLELAEEITGMLVDVLEPGMDALGMLQCELENGFALLEEAMGF